jgi:hypothetical protein
MSQTELRAVKLVFAEGGAFHDVVIGVPAAALARHPRLIDALREDEELAATLFVNFRRLVAAHVLEEAPG